MWKTHPPVVEHHAVSSFAAGGLFHSRSMQPLRERQRKRERDKARAARWADENSLQTPTTTAPGGLELERLWPNAPSCSGAAAPQAATAFA